LTQTAFAALSASESNAGQPDTSDHPIRAFASAGIPVIKQRRALSRYDLMVWRWYRGRRVKVCLSWGVTDLTVVCPSPESRGGGSAGRRPRSEGHRLRKLDARSWKVVTCSSLLLWTRSAQFTLISTTTFLNGLCQRIADVFLVTFSSLDWEGSLTSYHIVLWCLHSYTLPFYLVP